MTRRIHYVSLFVLSAALIALTGCSKGDSEALKKELADAKAAQATLETKLRDAEGKLKAAQDKPPVVLPDPERPKLEAQVKQLEGDVADAGKKVKMLSDKIVELEKRPDPKGMTAEIKLLKDENKKLDDDKRKAEGEKRTLATELDKAKEQSNDFQKQLNEIKNQLKTIEPQLKQLNSFKQEISDLKTRRDDLEDRRVEAEKREKAALEKLKAEQEKSKRPAENGRIVRDLDKYKKTKRVIVGYQPGMNETARELCDKLRLKVLDELKFKEGGALRCERDAELTKSDLELLDNPRIIQFVNPEGFTKPQSYKPSPLLEKNPDLKVRWGLKSISVDAAWECLRKWETVRAPTSQRPNEIKVAILDTGVDDRHPDLKPSFFDDIVGNKHRPEAPLVRTGGAIFRDAHGTHVAGIVTATANQTITDGALKRASFVKISAYKLPLNEDGEVPDFDLAIALGNAIDDGARIINISMSREESFSPDAITEAIRSRLDRKFLIVCAAGNTEARDFSDTRCDTEKGVYTRIPACVGRFAKDGQEAKEVAGRIITVGACDSQWKRCSFSCYGVNAVDLFAPGGAVWKVAQQKTHLVEVLPSEGIYSTIPTDYDRNQKYMATLGTSQSAPFVSAALALMWSHPTFRNDPDLSAEELKRRFLEKFTRRVTGLQGKDSNGKDLEGRVLDLARFSELLPPEKPDVTPEEPSTPVVLSPTLLELPAVTIREPTRLQPGLQIRPFAPLVPPAIVPPPVLSLVRYRYYSIPVRDYTHGSRELANEHFSRGLDLYWSGRYYGAIRSFRAAAALEPGRAEHQFFIAFSWASMEEFDEATAAVREALGNEIDERAWPRLIERIQGPSRDVVRRIRSGYGAWSLLPPPAELWAGWETNAVLEEEFLANLEDNTQPAASTWTPALPFWPLSYSWQMMPGIERRSRWIGPPSR